MSEFEIEDTKAVARGMDDEQMRVFLTEVKGKLLTEEIDRRLENAKKKDYLISKLVN
jgi:hypothetical protein